ncbi:DNA polymerase III subunit delta [Thalassotalea aquiviva]|uniref:DNA polymerase III subunit delta n=1 Tax=Thalassotalea aquiviva TaxID=3242415 RepID=UPI00352B6CEA
MRIYHSKLSTQLAQPLLPVWLVFGDEIWQKNDALDRIKNSAKAQGFDELIRFTNDDKLDWNQVFSEYQSLSLFSEQRLIEIDLVNNKVDNQASQIIADIIALINSQPQFDVMLLIHGPKLDSAASRKKWFKGLEKIGCYIPLYELEGKSLQIWLNQQCQQFNLKVSPQAQTMLLDFFSGNAPALAQELQKLTILFNNQTISAQTLEKLLIRQAKFTPFQLVDALLGGHLHQVADMLSQLKNEGNASAQVIWILHKELTQLGKMQQQLAQGMTWADVYKEHKVWDKKKPLYQHALQSIRPEHIKIAKQRLAKIDLLTKTSSDFDDYLLLLDVCMSLYHGDVTQLFPLDELA